ncbi:bifunctional riboflavin kinase/FAD synthetase [Sporolactobacillus spathodeae]|uniref:Riboflavin biosynthesis protein n=1 Tax=Sporolactobacillus spathodeae TaxID=1465502 RepID=A0ABS2Q5D6_9BACL|nr:bifunctional riboflavin kinase/FAD synthetase [Sporolactobacillus spathodeae]MBM7656992.1 riboflavin kinase/FMN adenylyltransferase [Sporolactobacillus spathodeae]
MKTIYLDKKPDMDEIDSQEKVVALGYFDGVHLGHQQVIQKAVSIAKEKGMESVVMTFYPHPSVVLKPSAKREGSLTPLEDKKHMIERLGVDLLLFVTFDLELSRLSPQEFVDGYLIAIHAKHIVAGFDYTFGRMAKGNMQNIGDYSRSMFGYTTIPRVERFGEKVSSTLIREYIQSGAVDEAAILLGRPYRTSGVVVHGDQRGRELGFPTANVETQADYLLPNQGVYAVRLTAGGKSYDGICSLGMRPTFYDEKKAVLAFEVYLLNFSGNLYGQAVSVDWHKRLRGQLKFADAQALILQMKKDEQETLRYFAAGLVKD